MDRHTQAVLNAHTNKKVYLNYQGSNSEMLDTCIKGNAVILAIGEWPKEDTSSLMGAAAIDSASFTECIYTQKHPSKDTMTYVEFIQDYYAKVTDSGSL